jgi:hypothetical protein
MSESVEELKARIAAQASEIAAQASEIAQLKEAQAASDPVSKFTLSARPLDERTKGIKLILEDPDAYIGKVVGVAAWIRGASTFSAGKNGHRAFLKLYDGTTATELQVVVNNTTDDDGQEVRMCICMCMYMCVWYAALVKTSFISLHVHTLTHEHTHTGILRVQGLHHWQRRHVCVRGGQDHQVPGQRPGRGARS